MPTVHFPRILGIEGVGEIAQTTDPQRLPVGQAVISIMGEMGRNFDGSYAEYALLPNQQIYPVTTDLPWSQLAVFPETYYTTYTSLKNLRPAPGDRYLIRGGTSGVGIAMLNLIRAKDPQAYVAGTSRSLAKAARMKDAGYSTVIKDQNGHLQTAEKFDKVLELIGPVTVKETFTHINEGGIVCVTGLLGNQWTLEHFDPITDIAPGAYLTGGYSGAVTEEKINELFSYLQRYQVAAKPDRIFALRDLCRPPTLTSPLARAWGRSLLTSMPDDGEPGTCLDYLLTQKETGNAAFSSLFFTVLTSRLRHRR